MKRGKRSASSADYERMVVAASQVVMAIRTARPNRVAAPVFFRFPYWVKFRKGFPQRQLVSKEGMNNLYKINAVKLLDWLHSQGHSPYNSSMLVAQTKQFERLEADIDRMFNI